MITVTAEFITAMYKLFDEWRHEEWLADSWLYSTHHSGDHESIGDIFTGFWYTKLGIMYSVSVRVEDIDHANRVIAGMNREFPRWRPEQLRLPQTDEEILNGVLLKLKKEMCAFTQWRRRDSRGRFILCGYSVARGKQKKGDRG